MPPRHVVVNADDFGLSPGVNEGVVRAHVEGIVTSTSLMVRAAAADDAARRARSLPRLGIGLHADFGEWTFQDGAWVESYRYVDPGDAAALERELVAQLERFEALVGRPPSHLDSHQHVHVREPAAGVFRRTAERLRIPMRDVRGGIPYVGRFYGQSAEGEPYPDLIRPAALASLFESLPPGWHEVACHPAASVDFASTYGNERLIELETLCSDEIRDALVAHGILLRSFADLRSR